MAQPAIPRCRAGRGAARAGKAAEGGIKPARDAARTSSRASTTVDGGRRPANVRWRVTARGGRIRPMPSTPSVQSWKRGDLVELDGLLAVVVALAGDPDVPD